MITLTLPDGSTRDLEAPVTGVEFAASISKSLAKKALALKLDGVVVDLATQIDRNCELAVITADDEEGVALMRHGCAHVMAEAVQELFPGTQVTIGPVIENGFFYDFARETPFSLDDLETIEKRMREIVERNHWIVREVWDRGYAAEHFRSIGELFKAEIIETIPTEEAITIYKQGNWMDLCRGPHVPSVGKIGFSFKLTKLAGAYWRGDSNNQMLQRIYGTCWANEKQLKAYLTMIEEAEKRDHRKIGREMNLFHLQEEAQGSVFWHKKGYVIWQALEQYIRRRLEANGYDEVKTPQLLDRRFWEQSGHWDKFRENMFVVPDEVPAIDDDAEVISGDSDLMALKPMNCPAHVQIFKQGIKSYRDLPIRMAEFGCCHRNEAHGALHGLMRVRQMTQDDAHIFCRDDQIIAEAVEFCGLVTQVYEDLGFNDVSVKLALRPDTRAGDDAVWDRAENGLRDALTTVGLEWEELPGEGAFYGPKIEYHLRDAIGRTWQCGTLQLDFVLPERLGASYIGEDGEKHMPVMLHRAILGTLERFIGIMIESYAGRMPLWLAPQQVIVCPITTEADDYAHQVVASLKAQGLRADADTRNEKINYKVREHSVAKVPVILAVGAREADAQTVSLRRLGSKDQEVVGLDDVATMLAEEACPPDLR